MSTDCTQCPDHDDWNIVNLCLLSVINVQIFMTEHGKPVSTECNQCPDHDDWNIVNLCPLSVINVQIMMTGT